MSLQQTNGATNSKFTNARTNAISSVQKALANPAKSRTNQEERKKKEKLQPEI